MFKKPLLTSLALLIIASASYFIVKNSSQFGKTQLITAPSSHSSCKAPLDYPNSNGYVESYTRPNICHSKQVFYNYGSYFATGNCGAGEWCNWRVRCPAGSEMQTHASGGGWHYSMSPNIDGKYDGPAHIFCADGSNNQYEPLPGESETNPYHSHSINTTKVSLQKVQVVDTNQSYYFAPHAYKIGIVSGGWVECPGTVDGPYAGTTGSLDIDYENFPNHFHCRNPQQNLTNAVNTDDNPEIIPFAATVIPSSTIAGSGFGTSADTTTPKDQFVDKNTNWGQTPLGTVRCVHTGSDKVYFSTTGTCPSANQFPLTCSSITVYLTQSETSRLSSAVTSFQQGQAINYVYACNPVASSAATVTVQLVKPDNTSTIIHSNTNVVESTVQNINTSNLTPGIYTIRACTDSTCQGGIVGTKQFTITSAPVNVAPSDASLISYWKFDGNGANEIAGAPALEIVGNAVFNSAGGKLNGYGYIPTGSDYFKVPYNSRYDLDEFTIEFWFRQRANRSYFQDLVYKGSPLNNYNFRIFRQLWNENNFGPIITGYTSSSTGWWTQTSNPNQLSHDNWHHVVFLRGSAERSYYLDGVLTHQGNDGNPLPKKPAVPIIIGDTAVDTDIDNLRIYNRALSKAEILQNGGFPQVQEPTPTPTPTPTSTQTPIILPIASTGSGTLTASGSTTTPSGTLSTNSGAITSGGNSTIPTNTTSSGSTTSSIPSSSSISTTTPINQTTSPQITGSGTQTSSTFVSDTAYYKSPDEAKSQENILTSPTPQRQCPTAITQAYNPSTAECKDFPTTCLPEGWIAKECSISETTKTEDQQPIKCAKEYLKQAKLFLKTAQTLSKNLKKRLEQTKNYDEREEVQNSISTADEQIGALDKFLKSKMTDETCRLVQDIVITVSEEIVPELEEYLLQIDEFTEFQQCHNRINGFADKLKNLPSQKAEVQDLLTSIETEQEKIDSGFYSIEDCEQFIDSIEPKISSALLSGDEELNRIADTVIADKLQPVLDKLNSQLKDTGNALEMVVSKVAQLYKSIEDLNVSALAISEKIVTSYTALSRIADKFSEQKLEIQNAKDQIIPLIDQITQKIKDTQCVTNERRDQILLALSDIAAVNWLKEEAVSVENKLRSFLSSCSETSIDTSEIETFITENNEIAKLNQQSSFDLGMTAFADVPTHLWYYGGMQNAAEHGFMKQGRPAEAILRQDALLMVLRFAGYKEVDDKKCANPGGNSISTVSQYALCAIEVGKNKGLAFSGDMTIPIQRGEIATWIADLNLVPDIISTKVRETQASYKDLGTDVAPEWIMAIGRLVDVKVMVGQITVETDRRWQPFENLNRASLAVILDHLLDLQ